MQNASQETELELVDASKIILGILMLDVDQSALLILNVQTTWLVSKRSVETHVLEPAAAMLSVL